MEILDTPCLTANTHGGVRLWSRPSVFFSPQFCFRVRQFSPNKLLREILLVSNGCVRLVVIVLDSSGHPVTDLRQNDFTVFDDELIRPIKAFVAITEAKGSPALQTVALPSTARSLAANVSRYEITFDALSAPALKGYHTVAVKVDRPNLRIITSQRYYAAR
jgi:hypothetical protein